MRLNKKDKLLLYAILKPWQPSDSWSKEEFAEYERFFKRLVHSMDRDGLNMIEDYEIFREAERILNGNKSDTVTKIRVEGGMFNLQKGDFDMKKLFESEEDS